MSRTVIYHDSASNEPERLHWNPAKECLFGVLIVIITFMAVLLQKFSCSKLQPEPNPPPSYHSERPEQQLENKLENYDVPASDEVFVIMDGEQKPSCSAKLVASSLPLVSHVNKYETSYGNRGSFTPSKCLVFGHLKQRK